VIPSPRQAWYGSPDFEMWTSVLCSNSSDMTAISMLWRLDRFLIAADGRCRSDDPTGKEKDRETDRAQKIFLIDSPIVKMACTVSGFVMTEKFDLFEEFRQKTTALPPPGFSNGEDYFHRICMNVKRSVIRARHDGRIENFPNYDALHSVEEKGWKFKLSALGYFKRVPFWILANFFHDEDTDTIKIRMNHLSLNQPCTNCSAPSPAIVNMMFGNVTPDPRLAKYKKPQSQPLEYTISVIQALSDPAAVEIEPRCGSVGGHIHAAEVTVDSARWLIAPLH